MLWRWFLRCDITGSHPSTFISPLSHSHESHQAPDSCRSVWLPEDWLRKCLKSSFSCLVYPPLSVSPFAKLLKKSIYLLQYEGSIHKATICLVLDEGCSNRVEDKELGFLRSSTFSKLRTSYRTSVCILIRSLFFNASKGLSFKWQTISNNLFPA